MKGRVASQFTQRGDVGSVYGGVQVDSALGLQEALVVAGLDWPVAKRPVVMADKARTPIPGFSATYRKDTNAPLGIVKTRYTPVQNADAFSWLSEIIGKDGACITSAGALHGGRYTWVCVDLGGFDVLPEDSVRKHMLVMNSHDGSSNLLVQLLPHRIVCQNILNFSFGARMGGGGSDPFKVRHTETAMIKMSEIQRVLSVANDNFGEVQEAFKLFKDTPVTSEQSTNIVYASLGVTPDDLAEFSAGEYKTQPQWVNHAGLINEVIDGGPGSDIPGVRGTVWGTFNGINSYYDHVRVVRGAEVNPDNAIESKLMGHSAKMKTKAFEACYESLATLRN